MPVIRLQWREGNYALHLFLDSLDECLLRIDTVASLIADQLPKEPVDRLRIRIACRTAPWPALLENALVTTFGDDAFQAYELAPLRRCDVEHALQRRGISDCASFFSRVEVLDVSSLAIKPVTLDFLINTYLRDGDLPANPIDLYDRGCRIHCEEAAAWISCKLLPSPRPRMVLRLSAGIFSGFIVWWIAIGLVSLLPEWPADDRFIAPHEASLALVIWSAFLFAGALALSRWRR